MSSKQTVRLHLTEAGNGQVFLVGAVQDCKDASLAAADTFTQLGEMLNRRGMTIVQERIFGSVSVKQEVMAARKRSFQERNIPTYTPLTYIEGRPPWGTGFTGVIVRAVAVSKPGDEVWTIREEGQPCGTGWRRNGITFTILQNIQGIEKGPARINTPAMQATRMIERAEGILGQQGLRYRDVVRTWFYLADILKWYDTFNEVRNAKYNDYGIMPESGRQFLALPASTGIEGISPQRAACTMDLVAVALNVDTRPAVVHLRNESQRDALCYGAAFSRGTFIREGDVSLIEVSGTAAIGTNGLSLYPDDIRAQIRCTFDTIERLISQRGAQLEDICAGTVFLKHPEHEAAYREIAQERGLINLPCLCVVGDICREDLLVEIDAEVAFDCCQQQQLLLTNK
jgi:enamine deaminase RidA (YjgF/YER057c/UK114 family)